MKVCGAGRIVGEGGAGTAVVAAARTVSLNRSPEAGDTSTSDRYPIRSGIKIQNGLFQRHLLPEDRKRQIDLEGRCVARRWRPVIFSSDSRGIASLPVRENPSHT